MTGFRSLALAVAALGLLGGPPGSALAKPLASDECRRDRASGRRSRVVPLRRVRRCFFPRTLSVRLEARFSAG
jgi:hypothetical protein